ncbi:MAG: A/G-specific adenine glycosylase [bacterium]|nr:A/G-specific adenine glycosylase [bacterium]
MPNKTAESHRSENTRLPEARWRRAIRERLLRWYDREKRELPWRGEKDPYRIWVSESMLQQTRAETVRARYLPFLARFPTIAALADAPLESVLAEWQGMGYYARARNLHRAARRIADAMGGKLPEGREALRALPGVGPYMAGALASIAFGERTAAVDGNVLRVLSRLLDCALPVDAPKGRAFIEEEAEALVPSSRPGDFNQALMDLGARICTPRNPACGACPLRLLCAAREAGTVSRRPRKKKKTPPAKTTAVQLWGEQAGRLLLRKRPDEGLFGGMWELPGEMAEGHARSAKAPLLEKICAAHFGAGWRAGPEIARLERTLTHRKIRFIVHAALPASSRRDRRESEDRLWADVEEISALPLSSAQRAVLRAVHESRNGTP